MRVIAGKAKGRKLESVPGSGTRPITDRAKEALFNILGGDIVGARFLDLFGGTGAVGIEALSRGAAEVVFVERGRGALKTIRRNLAHTKLEEGAVVLHDDAFRFLQRPGLVSFDLIYVAPPQYKGLWLKALEMIDKRPEILTPSGEVVVQLHPKEYEEPGLIHLQRVDTRRYGSVQLDFYVAGEELE
ncbi:MAG: 16S rRNA (guanine(966)-N(2))-methyltransferase RsmD [Chloroflexi bacterium]|nr:16S rRNA (guanine(966)-N(2))-methyltransferase RsmD [Chloroflexota bacterium]